MNNVPAAAVEAAWKAYVADNSYRGLDRMRVGLTAALPHLSGRYPARYFCSGPQGAFWTDSLNLARALVNAFDWDDDWTVTDMTNPTGQEVGGGR